MVGRNSRLVQRISYRGYSATKTTKRRSEESEVEALSGGKSQSATVHSDLGFESSALLLKHGKVLVVQYMHGSQRCIILSKNTLRVTRNNLNLQKRRNIKKYSRTFGSQISV